MEEQPIRKRRVHYSGKYPRKFEEKYKELQPEKYAEMQQHIRDKGNTPAGTHISIMVEEILEHLDIRPGMRGLDCTFGYGGHSRRMLERLGGEGHLTVLDVDPIESAKSLERLRREGYGEELLSLELTNFENIASVAEKYGKFDFVLADLGVSSMQIDNPERGFTYKADGPLDLRMDPTHGRTAAELLLSLSEEELIGLLLENADEPFAHEIARTVTALKKEGRCPATTLALRAAVETALTPKTSKKERKDAVKKSCARVFQALRIEVNHEYEALFSLLEHLPEALNPGGRVAILTFHSGEDRLVKQSFRQYTREGLYSDCARDVLRPSPKECADNPRAKPAKLRWAVK